MTTQRPAERSPRVSATLSADAARWTLENTTGAPIWVFTDVPVLREGALRYGTGAAWVLQEGDQAILRVADAPVPDDLSAERVEVGAVQLAPGAVAEGRVALDGGLQVWTPYGEQPSRRLQPRGVVVEVGWIPVREGQFTRSATIDGRALTFLRPEGEPGGQRLSRSASLPWAEGR